jgi:acyl carrier protein
MTIEAFIENFVDSIEGLEPGSVEPDTVMRNLPQWDSLAVLTTVAMIDAEYEVLITTNELADQQTVGDLFKLVNSKKNA